MATNQKVVVDRKKLIEAIKVRRAEEIRGNEKALKEEPAQVEAWRKKAHAAVDAYKPGWDEYSYRRGFWCPDPPSPRKKPDTSSYDRSIAMLEMSTIEVIAITGEDFAQYIR